MRKYTQTPSLSKELCGSLGTHAFPGVESVFGASDIDGGKLSPRVSSQRNWLNSPLLSFTHAVLYSCRWAIVFAILARR